MDNHNNSSLCYKLDVSPLEPPSFNQFIDTAFTPIKLSNSSSGVKDPFSFLKTQNQFSTSVIDSNSTNQKHRNFLQITKKTNFSSFETAFDSSSPFVGTPNLFSTYQTKPFNTRLFNSKYNFSEHLKQQQQQQQHNTFIGRKTRKFRKFISPQHKTKYYLNEISVNGFHIENFPFINIDSGVSSELTEVKLLSALEKKRMYFIKKPNTLLLPLQGSNSNSSNNVIIFDYENDIIDEIVLKENNINFYEGETSIKNIMICFYKEIKDILLLMEYNYIHHKNKILNENNILKLELLIRNCNLFTNFVKRYIQKPLLPTTTCDTHCGYRKEEDVDVKRIESCLTLTKNKNKKNNFTKKSSCMQVVSSDNELKFKCDYCNKTFSNGQALGGHISQLHPKQSEKYKKKVEIRQRRTKQRSVILECRKTILANHGFNYDTLLISKKKNVIKAIIKQHNAEYKKLLMRMKKEKLKDKDNNNSVKEI